MLTQGSIKKQHLWLTFTVSKPEKNQFQHHKYVLLSIWKAPVPRQCEATISWGISLVAVDLLLLIMGIPF